MQVDNDWYVGDLIQCIFLRIQLTADISALLEKERLKITMCGKMATTGFPINMLKLFN